MKKFVALIVSFCMVFSLLTTLVSAAESPFPTDTINPDEFVISNRLMFATSDNKYVLTTTADITYPDGAVREADIILSEWAAGFNTNQKWSPVSAANPSAPDALRIYSPVNIQQIALQRNSAAEGVRIIARDVYGERSDQFIFEQTPDGYYTIQSVTSGLYLGPEDGVAAEGASICQYKEPYKWNIYKVEDEKADRIVTTQTGWLPNSFKRAVFSSKTKLDAPPEFTVTKDGVEVMSGTMTEYEGDFFQMFAYGADLTSLEEIGNYQISVNLEGIAPANFFIGEDVYRSVYGRDPDDSSVIRHTTIADITDGFYQWQRCTPDKYVPMDQFVSGTDPGMGLIWGDNDTNLPVYAGRTEAESVLTDTRVDLPGGYIDATSSDKETGSVAKAMASFLFAYRYASDPADKAAILDELYWGCDYLVQAQKENGSFYISVKPYNKYEPDSPVRSVLDIEGADLACRVGASLAGVAIELKEINPEKSAEYMEAAVKAWDYYEANPTNILTEEQFPGPWRGSVGSIVALAAYLYSETGNPKYSAVADAILEEGDFISGVFTKWDGKFLGEASGLAEEILHGQLFEAMAFYYPYASDEIREKIEYLVDSWMTTWKIRSENAYQINGSIIFPWFGGMGGQIVVAEKMLLLALAFNNKDCLEIATAAYDFATGGNPAGTSFIVGFGDILGAEPFARPRWGTWGGVVPGLFVGDDGYLTSRCVDGSIYWKMSECTLDSTSCLPSTMMMMQHAYTVQYDDIMSGKPTERLSVPEYTGDDEPAASDPAESGSSEDSAESNLEVSGEDTSGSPVLWIVIIGVVVIAIAAGVAFGMKKSQK